MVMLLGFPGIIDSELISRIDMREHFVIDPLIGKRQQLLLATQLCRMVLKVCERSSLANVSDADTV